MRATTKWSVLGILTILMWTPTAEAATTCDLVSSGTACPTAANAFIHRLTFQNFLGASPNLSGNDTILIGKYGSILQACINGSWFYVMDFDGSTTTTVSSLRAASYFCTGSGNDIVTVVTTATSCGGFTLQPFDYGGYTLYQYGQGGNDVMSGGAGVDYMCGGDGDDWLRGGASSDRMWGMDGRDLINGQGGLDSMYGGIGSDCLSGDVDSIADVLHAEENLLSGECIFDDAAASAQTTCGSGGGEVSAGSLGSIADCGGGTATNCVAFCGIF